MNKKKLLIISAIVAFFVLAIGLFFTFIYSININGKDEVRIKVFDTYEDKGASAKIFSKDISSDLQVKSDVDTNKIGKYEIEYTIKLWGIKKTKTRIVIVYDDEKPVITLSGEDIVSICPSKDYEEIGYSASDNYDGDITDNVKVEHLNEKIVYTVKDSSGNEFSISRYLKKEDNENPIIDLNKKNTITVTKGNTYKDQNVTASDNCDGDLTDKIETSSIVDTNKSGTYTITYKVKDSSGNETTSKRTIKVVEKTTTSNFYQDIVAGPTYINGILIVNKKYSLPKNFGNGLTTETKNAFNKLQAAALVDGFNLKITSGYRSYNTQNTLYNNYVKKDGVTKADTYSARPGHSEHQTGLAIDVGPGVIRDSAIAKWIKDNCAKYGFIVRYPDKMTYITGYQYEPWHLRYIGIDIATEIMSKGITLEEYLKII